VNCNECAGQKLRLSIEVLPACTWAACNGVQ
jgi:hypothetical protein